MSLPNQAKYEALAKQIAELGIERKDVVEKAIKGSGKGGQKVNKSANQIYLKHLATGIEVKCHASRSKELNHFLAWRELCERLVQLRDGKSSKAKLHIVKMQRRKARKKRRQQAKNKAPDE